jgi:hypothetical protein
MPSLFNASLRVQWGGERLKELTAIHDAICADNREAIVIELDEDTPIPPGESRQVLRIDRSQLVAIPPPYRN